ncbi:MAG: deoxyribodipyrimidine photolyase [Alphaproteobacteria bacterium]|nr:deoxyribodipyrimidine photolyase [Alphaproteobacteria bacterium]
MVHEDRARRLGSGAPRPIRGDRAYVLYWMIAQRRTRWNPALDVARAHAAALGVPLLVFEPLRAGYRWASVRHHRFVVQGMRDNAAACRAAGVTYLPYVEPEDGAGAGLLEALAAQACLVVTDDWPAFFLPRMVAAAADALDVPMIAVDGCGVLPLSAHGRSFPVAHAFRRHAHKILLDHLPHRPAVDALDGYDLGAAAIPPSVSRRWPAADLDALLAGGLDRLPIDQRVGAVPYDGGPKAAAAELAAFLDRRIARYTERSHPDEDAASGLSPWLHFGHVSAAEVAHAVLERDGWTPDAVDTRCVGNRAGWWGASEAAESFLDELITWRELGYGYCLHEPDGYDRYEALPDWALQTLADHAGDPRPHRYDLETLAAAKTSDPLWNAAQRQLVAEGRIHNYLRMLWGKNVLAWTSTPEVAFHTLIELNNRYAVDGRDPNSYSGIAWTFGRFDRAWGPERPIYGKVRYMTSDNTRRKLHLSDWLDRWGDQVTAPW